MRHIIVLPDGTELSSGAGEKNAIRNTSFSFAVNSGQELSPGAMCASVFDASIISPGGSVQIQEGSELAIFSEEKEREKIGLFTTQKPTRSSANMYRIQAFDRMIRLDRDISAFIDSLQDWPYRLYDLAVLVLGECGLTLRNAEIPNGEYLVRQFSANGITARTILQKIGEACCRFGRITPDGDFEFAWFQETGLTVTPSKLFRGSLSYEDYETYQIENVQIRQTEGDVGVSFPGDNEDANTFAITGNFLLTADTTEDLFPVAERIYREMENITYTPCKFAVWYPSGISAGDIVTVIDRNGKTIKTCAMNVTRAGSKQIVQSSGSYRRDSTAVVNEQAIGSALYGKILEIKKSIEGLRIAAKDLESKLSTELNLVADGLEMVITQVDGIQTYYRFDADGQYIGRTDDEAVLRLSAGVVDILVAGYPAATFDRTGLRADQATVKSLNIGEYTLSSDEQGFLNLS